MSENIPSDGVNIAARLEGIADAGGICLSEDAYRQVRDRLKEGFTDLGERELKNIARPVRVYAVKTGAPAPAPHASASEKSGPPRLSVVVLPFANLGGDPEQEYFVDGVSDTPCLAAHSIQTRLSAIPKGFAMAPIYPGDGVRASRGAPRPTPGVEMQHGLRPVEKAAMGGL